MMPSITRRRTWTFFFAGIILFCFYSFKKADQYVIDPFRSRIDLTNDDEPGTGVVRTGGYKPTTDATTADTSTNTNTNTDTDTSTEELDDKPIRWKNFVPQYPVKDMRRFPKAYPKALPKVQKYFDEESDPDREVRVTRREAVKATFKRCWKSYRERAWLSDELAPVSGGKRDTFGGWGATLVDSLDTLWIMGMKDEFEEAVTAASKIDFQKIPDDKLNVFETNIRYLGGFLSAYDLSGDKRLLRKAKEVGDMLYVAFDTPNRMPITRWDANAARLREPQVADETVLLAEIGSFSLEFIRLSLVTEDSKWFDAVQRITEKLHNQQMTSKLPGMWPVIVNAKKEEFNTHVDYTIGAMADSLYEYLPKTYALAGGLLPEYREMYEAAMDMAIRHNFFRPMLPDGKDVLVSGMVNANKDDGEKTIIELRPEGQHLVCFAGGMLAFGGKLTENSTHVEKGEKLMDGCVWAYLNMPIGIMPEVFSMLPCDAASECSWDEEKWKKAVLEKAGVHGDDVEPERVQTVLAEKRIPKGFTSIGDSRYILRPEAIESVFILYRTTGRKDLPDTAWKMFEAIEKYTKTELANSALSDITAVDEDGNPKPKKSDSMESFWLGETLKYFYLIFSEPDVITLDEYVFNTEAHPLKRLLPRMPRDYER
ncbi:glycoside hydrolase [Podospora australis]|uniref:alpha-1,2-Mannosidase n=1 Tax=Podospora australis TaxID=1536484 RepID=A0AAN6WNY6_9PEZI|nr:glycoside hydrolase [Podospora australis]